MLTPLKLVVGLVGVFWLFLAGIAYTVYLPAGWPNYPRFGLWAFHAPWAGAVQAEHAKRVWTEAQWAQCRTNEDTLKSAIASQNAAVASLAAQGLRAREEAERAVGVAQARLTKASEVRAVISAPVPKADNVCEAAKVVDQRFVGALR